MKKKGELTVSELARMGGHARAKALTAEQRKEMARNAVRARWDRVKAEKRAAPPKKGASK